MLSALAITLALICTVRTTEFLSIYDMGKAAAGHLYPDLLNHGPRMKGKGRVENGAYISEYKNDWVDENGNVLKINYANREAVTMITIFKPAKCEHMSYLMWTWVNSAVNPHCGLLCTNDFDWKLACRDFAGSNYFSPGIKLDQGAALILGLTFFAIEDYMAMRLIWRKSDGRIAEYIESFKTVNYKRFVSDAKLSYASYTGELYYLAFVPTYLDSHTFSAYLSSAKSILTPSCPNCLSSSLTCPNTNFNIVPYVLREYYCSCGIGMAYDIDLESCVNVVTSCKLPCDSGCIPHNENSCVLSCPAPFVVKEAKGDYMVCECEGGGIVGDSKGWCKKGRSGLFWFCAVGLPIIGTVIGFIPLYLSLIHICRCRRSTLCRSRWSPYH
eukprot:TRINITY_DN5620_c0_g3_i1.p1 TRINITY_DN5620_c0_g3~~TRINITY_DN5620_c0_g3_i1.p1  ORF type:complete len:385 (-),score=66.73 TRINITY_DN5620_c0_g3_i1:22-1176(-)